MSQQNWNTSYDGSDLNGYINPHQLVLGKVPGISLKWINAQEAGVSQKPLLVFDRLLFNGHVMYVHKMDMQKGQVTVVETVNGTLINYPVDEVPLHILKEGPYKGQPRTVCGADDPRQYFLEIENVWIFERLLNQIRLGRGEALIEIRYRFAFSPVHFALDHEGQYITTPALLDSFLHVPKSD